MILLLLLLLLLQICPGSMSTLKYTLPALTLWVSRLRRGLMPWWLERITVTVMLTCWRISTNFRKPIAECSCRPFAKTAKTLDKCKTARVPILVNCCNWMNCFVCNTFINGWLPIWLSDYLKIVERIVDSLISIRYCRVFGNKSKRNDEYSLIFNPIWIWVNWDEGNVERDAVATRWGPFEKLEFFPFELKVLCLKFVQQMKLLFLVNGCDKNQLDASNWRLFLATW